MHLFKSIVDFSFLSNCFLIWWSKYSYSSIQVFKCYTGYPSPLERKGRNAPNHYHNGIKDWGTCCYQSSSKWNNSLPCKLSDDLFLVIFLKNQDHQWHAYISPVNIFQSFILHDSWQSFTLSSLNINFSCAFWGTTVSWFFSFPYFMTSDTSSADVLSLLSRLFSASAFRWLWRFCHRHSDALFLRDACLPSSSFT